MESTGFYEDAFRVPLLEKARDERGILICVVCGWAWLTVDTAKIANTMKNFAVVCRNDYDCFRRQQMNLDKGVCWSQLR